MMREINLNFKLKRYHIDSTNIITNLLEFKFDKPDFMNSNIKDLIHLMPQIKNKINLQITTLSSKIRVKNNYSFTTN